jgi:PII-like signaling protein
MENSHEQGRSAMKEQFPARMLRIHFGEGDKWQGKPLHEAIVAKVQELGLGDAIVYRGIEGFGSSTRIHHSSHWTFSSDAPIMVSIIDTEEQIARLLPYLDAMVEEGLIAISDVEVIRYVYQEGVRSQV